MSFYFDPVAFRRLEEVCERTCTAIHLPRALLTFLRKR